MLASLTLTVSVLAGCGDDPTGEGTGTTDDQSTSTGDEVLAGSMTELFAQYLQHEGKSPRIIEVAVPGAMGKAMRQGGILPDTSARLGQETFTDWLARQ